MNLLLTPQPEDTPMAALRNVISPLIVIVLSFVVTVLSAYSQSTVEVAPPAPDIAVIVPSLEQVAQENPALTHPYGMIRQYKAFGAGDSQLTSEITAEISFVPPSQRTFTVIREIGSSTVKKIVRAMLEQETQPARPGHSGDITRANYDFVFVRKENFGTVPEYVLHIIPKRKEKNLLLGLIWVDEKTFHIRRVEGVPAQSPSIWIKDIHMTLQFGDVNGMWLPVSLDAIATIRFSGRYTLAGTYVGPLGSTVP